MKSRSTRVRLRARLEKEWDFWRTWRSTGFLRNLEPPTRIEGSALLVTMTNRSIGAKSYGLLGRRLQMEGFRPVVLTSPHLKNAIRVYRLFGIDTFELIDPDAVAPRGELDYGGLENLSEETLLRVRYRDVNIGRAVLNTVTREGKLGSLDYSSDSVRERIRLLLSRSAGLVDAVEPLLRRIAPSVALFQGDRGYSPVAEIFGSCLKIGIPAVPIFASHRADAFILKRYTSSNELDHPISLSDASWLDLLEEPWSEDRDREIMDLLVSVYENATWFAHIYERGDRRIATSSEIRRNLGIDPDTRVGVIFPHVLWDASFFYGDSLFPNYESWLIESIRAAGRSRGIDWIVRFHPAYVTQRKLAKLDGLDDLMRFRRRLVGVPDNVRFVEPEEDLSALALLRMADVCATVQGTVGIEAPCHGVPVLTAGSGRYSGKGFTIESSSREEYLDRIENAASIPPLDEKVIERARRFAHALFFRRPWSFSSFEVWRRPLEELGRSLDRNLRLNVSTADEFLEANDLRCFADWVLRSEAEDYLEGSPTQTGEGPRRGDQTAP